MSPIIEEGDFKNFTFKMLTPLDYPALGEHMQNNFCTDEPMLQRAGVTEKDIDEFQKLYQILEQNLSFAAYDKESGKMAAVRLMCHNRGGDKEKYMAIQNSIKSPQIHTALKFLRQTEAEAGDIAQFFNVRSEDLANLCRTSVHRDFRSHGLATEMYRRGLALLKECGFLVAKTIFTNPYSQRAALKLGFRELSRRHFRQMEDMNGRLVCPEEGDDEYGAVMAIRL